MTGTALTSQEEFYSVYKLDVIPVPTHREIKRKDHDDLIYQSEKGKTTAIIKRVKEVHATGQPILIGTASIDKNEELSAALTKAGIVHEMLNAKNHEREGEIIAEAGKRGRVTLATNMAGRGVDIKLGGAQATPEEAEEIRALGGLFVLGTERHEARRIDNQLRGRSGRQGDPGETQFYVSMDDTLMRVFASDMVKNMMGRFGIPEDEPIQNSMITRSLETAQKKIEGFHFDARKQVLAYDNVLNQQRHIIYERRGKLLEGSLDAVKENLEAIIERTPAIRDISAQRALELGETQWFEVVRRLMLQVNDMLWVEHLEVMQHTRSSVSLRAYGQQDPLIEYRKEAVRLFKEMQEAYFRRVGELLPNIRIEAVEREESARRKVQENLTVQGAGQPTPKQAQRTMPIQKERTYGRNDLVTITDGTHTETVKYKKAEERIQSGAWRIVENV
jgi:preprotein translocase subunit SecA